VGAAPAGGETPSAVERPDGWEPEFEGQRPPFTSAEQLGNQAAVTHGGYSLVGLAPEAEAASDWLRGLLERQGLYQAAYEPMIQLAGRKSARLARVYRALDELDDRIGDDPGALLASYLPTREGRDRGLGRLRDEASRLEAALRRCLSELALTPAAYTRIARDAGMAAWGGAAAEALQRPVEGSAVRLLRSLAAHSGAGAAPVVGVEVVDAEFVPVEQEPRSLDEAAVSLRAKLATVVGIDENGGSDETT
jgi:hypothetical protein